MEGIKVENVFNDFKGRRAGLIKALTNGHFLFSLSSSCCCCFLCLIMTKIACVYYTDLVEFYQTCDPERNNLCLYGLPNETWEVKIPDEKVPTELPEPVLGINFSREGIKERDWVSLVAIHSDSWLLSVAFYFGARFGFGMDERKRLFKMINKLPTIFEEVIGDDEEQSCGVCEDKYMKDEFWISCDVCEKWFHGKCVKITPSKAEYIKLYKCSNCNNKRPKPLNYNQSN
ncbi:unnamed protein product [Cochlearia groenlandica]